MNLNQNKIFALEVFFRNTWEGIGLATEDVRFYLQAEMNISLDDIDAAQSLLDISIFEFSNSERKVLEEAMEDLLEMRLLIQEENHLDASQLWSNLKSALEQLFHGKKQSVQLTKVTH